MTLGELKVGDRFKFINGGGYTKPNDSVHEVAGPPRLGGVRVRRAEDNYEHLRDAAQPVEVVKKDSDETVTNAAGGKQSRLDARMDLLPPKALMRIAEILAAGAKKYGNWNWKKIDNPDHINHSIVHYYKFLTGDTAEDHLANAACRALFALEMELDKK